MLCFLCLVTFGVNIICFFLKIPLPLGYLVQLNFMFMNEVCQSQSFTQGFKDDFCFEFSTEYPAGSFPDDGWF